MDPTLTGTSSRGVKRVLQACENCRRKKTRCPGEKPRCSNCTRLAQTCRYPGNYTEDGDAASSSGRTLEERLAQLEEKLDLVLDRPGGIGGGVDPSPRQGETPQSPCASMHRPRTSSMSYSRILPSWEVLAEAIRIYFRCSHRQPIWLFEPPNQISPDSPEELLLSILGLSVQYAQEGLGSGSGAQIQSPSAYNDAARSLIMLKIANSTVDLTTLQSLCLLAMSNLAHGDVQLASFHTNLASTLVQCSGLDTHSSPDRTEQLEQQRRLFWSIQALKAICGLPVRIPSTRDIQAPSFLVLEEQTLRKASGRRAPLLPVESHNKSNNSSQAEKSSLGIWAHMIRSAGIWALVRAHIWRCAENQARPPWHPDSDYTTINSLLLDSECSFPVAYRYDAGKFPDRSPAELEKNRDFWLPWMKIQVTYHTLHSVLNHPFLYSSRVSKPRPGPNAFWKTSTDLALLHSTWVARLLGMAMSKGLELADPFFGYAASVAITLHLYWSRVGDPKIRTPALENLEVCRTFLARLGAHWPLVQSIVDDVDNLIQLAAAPERQPQQASEEPPATINVQISLMWKILDFASTKRSGSGSGSGSGLFQASWEASLAPSRASSQEQMMLEDPDIAGSPPGDLQTTAGSYAEPPNYFSPTTNTSPGASRHEALHAEAMPASNIGVEVSMPPLGAELRQQNLSAGHPSWAWDPSTDSNMFYDPFTQFYDRCGGPETSWWDYGNL